jgi:hypothetical protein
MVNCTPVAFAITVPDFRCSSHDPGLRNVMKTVRTPKSWSKKLSRVAVAISMLLTSQGGQSQDGASTFGRSPYMGGSPSGSASEVVESNRNGFGMSFRGGHVAGDTVGRSESATHFNLSPYINIEDGLFFGDTRLLVANQGGLAWSFGGGYRHYIADWDVVVGGNSYIDQDQLTNVDLQQWGAGAEILAYGWEARGNYYQTYGDTFGSDGSRVDQSSVAFVEKNIQYTRIDSFASGLGGWDSEIGFLLPGEISEKIDLRAFGGAYAYDSDQIDQFAGWSSRIQADIAKWLELGLKVTNDRVFDTTVSFNVAMHFGGFRSQEHTQRSAIQRFSEPVRRNLNVVTAVTDVSNPGQIARDPVTNQPFVVAHVNSNYNGPFNGTVNNPFNTLGAGLGDNTADIVFVHAGSQFTNLPTVNLTEGQKLFGEGNIPGGGRFVTNTLNLDIGQLNLPSSPTLTANPSFLRPILQQSTGNAVNLANNSQFSGFIVDSPTGVGIFGNQTSGVVINDVLVRNSAGSGIRLNNSTGATKIQNTIIENTAGNAFHVDGGGGTITFLSTQSNNSTQPSFASILDTDGSNAFLVLVENMTAGGNVNMLTSTVSATGGRGIRVQNNAGDVTIDNARVVNSTGNGIAIVDSSGDYLFRNTIRLAENENLLNGTTNGTYVSGAAGDAILIDGLQTGGTVAMRNVIVEKRNAAGIRVNNSDGAVTFSREPATADTNLITTSAEIRGAVNGTAAAVQVTNSQNDGSVTFTRDLRIGTFTETINNNTVVRAGSNGRGVNLSGNAVGSQFSVSGITSIASAAGESIAIVGDNSAVNFAGGAVINNRTGTGILIDSTNFDNSGASIVFGGGVSIANTAENRAATSGVIVNNSRAGVTFNGLGVSFVTGADAIVLTGNRSDPADPTVIGDAVIRLGRLTVEEEINNGRGIFALNNDAIISTDVLTDGFVGGAIATNGAAAIDIENSGINLQLQSVSSSGAPDFGIRLVDTNKVNGAEGARNRFFVTGNGALDANGFLSKNGSGGEIIDAGTAGVQLEDAGQVQLQQMSLSNNLVGINVENTIRDRDIANIPNVDLNTAAEVFNNQFVILKSLQITGSDERAVHARNVKLFEMTDSLLDDDATATSDEMVLLEYDRRLNTDNDPVLDLIADPSLRPAPVPLRYDVYLTRNEIRENNGDAVSVVLADQAAANGALIFLEAADNIVTMTDDSNEAFSFDWNGSVQSRFLRNDVELSSVNAQDAFNINMRSTTQNFLMTLDQNVVTATAPGVDANTPIAKSGVVLRTLGPSAPLVSSNIFTFDTGVIGTGLNFRLADDAFASILNNRIVLNNTQTGQRNGMLFDRVEQISTFNISGNTIANGNIRFRTVVGQVQLLSTQSNVVSPTFGLIMPPGSNLGQIIINGALRP